MALTQTRPMWGEWALSIAKAVATRADCTRRQVGAVILEADTQHVLSVGYNGLPAGKPGCLTAGACPRGQLTYDQLGPENAYTGTGVDAPCDALHAEENCLMHAPLERARGASMFVTCEPCAGCKRLLLGSVLREVIWQDGPNTARVLTVSD